MADLCWIENIGARGFSALAKKAPNPTLAEIYRYFHAEEQRHANAELALMKRWGMLDDGEIPEPNVNIRMAMSGWTPTQTICRCRCWAPSSRCSRSRSMARC